MSRWRPPATEKASPWITAAGLERLRAEYEQLWKGRRPEVVKALAAAAAEGDRSENAEYQYRKKELREIDRRVRYLQMRLAVLRVPEAPADTQRVHFAACVAVAFEDGREQRLQLVGGDEAEAGTGRISVDAPLARALLGRRQGDVVSVALPQGVQEVEILEVWYDHEASRG